MLDYTPTHLRWVQLADTTACFEAEHEGHLFSVNLLTGVLLYDGAPPGFLPEDMINNDHYQRLFGKAKFEVAVASNGVFKTIRAISGRFYEFSREADSDKVVKEELDKCQGEQLRLLRFDGAWGKDLPVRLRTMHSQWLCRDHGAIVMRPKDFRKHDVAFIIQYRSSGPASCFDVPSHLNSHGCKALLKRIIGTGHDLGSKGRLVLLPEGSNVMTVLAKFEPRATGPNALIYTYLQPDGGLKIELPRFELEFEVESSSTQQKDGCGSGVCCRNHLGYQLARAQQLQDTLPGLVRYLVLHREGQGSRVMVPRGNAVVEEGATPRVRIECQHEGSEDAELKVYCYTVHRRWSQLDAGGIPARLQLAAMYAATGTLLPDPRAGMTGSEKVAELVRRCFVNRSLQKGDRQRLLRVLGLSGLNPALALLCGDLLESSMNLNVLHREEPKQLPREATKALEHAAIAYEGDCAALPWHQRRRRRGAEEVRVLGWRVSTPSKLHECSFEHTSAKLPRTLISAQQVQAVEINLQKVKDALLSAGDNKRRVASSDDTVHPYPLTVPPNAETLTDEKHAELRTSWEDYHRDAPDPPGLPTAVLQHLHEELGAQHSEVSLMRQALSKDLLQALITFGPGAHAAECRMQRVAGLLPNASLQDLPPMLWENWRIQQLNPFLARSERKRLTTAVATWLRLCVLEDKLERLQTWTRTSDTEALMWQELQVRCKSCLDMRDKKLCSRGN